MNIEGISLYGYDPSVIHPLYASSIAFTPTGERSYIGSGRFLMRSGTISVIDTHTRDIVENIWPDLGHFILKMEVGPKL